MKNKKLVVICSVFIILLSIGLIVFTLTNKKEEEKFEIEGIELVKNKEVLNDATVEELKITNVSLIIRNGISTYSAEVTNSKNEEIHVSKLYVTFYIGEAENKILALSDAMIGANGKTIINITSETDLSEVTKITYTIEDESEE